MSPLAGYVTKQLENDLAWREAELAVLKTQLALSTPGSLHEKTLLRTNLAMLYAHYEGFCKFALETYIDALDKLTLKRKDLRWPLATYSLRDFHAELLKEKDSTAFFEKLFSEFDKRIDEIAEYERPPTISNLWPDLLTEWLDRLNLDSTNVKYNHTILESLVNKRNQIAHGKNVPVKDRADLLSYSNAATLAMHEVAIGIANALERRSYKRSSIVSTILSHAS